RPGEAVAPRVLDGGLAAAPDALVVVADACSLERSLPFVAQVLLRGRPTSLGLTLIDELAARRRPPRWSGWRTRAVSSARCRSWRRYCCAGGRPVSCSR